MRLVDLSHPWSMHTPGWVGYPGSKIYYTQNLQTNQIVSQRVETSLHVGTHLDGPMHARRRRRRHRLPAADQAHPRGRHRRRLRRRRGLGHHHARSTSPTRMEVKQRRHPHPAHRLSPLLPGQAAAGPRRATSACTPAVTRELAQWMHDMQISWWGIDAGSGDHPMNTTIRDMRPDLTHQFEEHVGTPGPRVLRRIRVPPPPERPPREGRDLPDAPPRLPRRVHPRRERRRRHREGAQHRAASSAPSRGRSRAARPAPAASSPSSTSAPSPWRRSVRRSVASRADARSQGLRAPHRPGDPARRRLGAAHHVDEPGTDERLQQSRCSAPARTRADRRAGTARTHGPPDGHGRSRSDEADRTV